MAVDLGLGVGVGFGLAVGVGLMVGARLTGWLAIRLGPVDSALGRNPGRVRPP
jgi:hypothetical protein